MAYNPSFDEITSIMNQKNMTYEEAESYLKSQHLGQTVGNIQTVFGGLTTVAKDIFSIFGTSQTTTATTTPTTTGAGAGVNFNSLVVPVAIIGGVILLTKAIPQKRR